MACISLTIKNVSISEILDSVSGDLMLTKCHSFSSVVKSGFHTQTHTHKKKKTKKKKKNKNLQLLHFRPFRQFQNLSEETRSRTA